MLAVGHIRHALCTTLLVFVAYCLSVTAATSAAVTLPGHAVVSQQSLKKACSKLTAPASKKHKCSRITVTSSPANGRSRSDEADLSLWLGQKTLGPVTWVVTHEVASLPFIVLHSRGDPGGRAPFWRMFAAAPRLRN